MSAAGAVFLFGGSVSYLADYLVVAGGGSGGTGNTSGFIGGGGGAGDVKYITSASLAGGTVYTATVGPGGAAITNTIQTVGNDGTASSLIGGLLSTTSLGGGGGGLANGTTGGNGRNGGSSGGGGGNNSTPTTAGTASGSNANVGGAGGGSSNIAAAGSGGGAGAAGTTMVDNGTNLLPTAGLANSITGASVTYGKGGGCYNSASPPAISANTGNGGSGYGGTAPNTSIAGSSGVVILRVPTANYSGTTTGSPTVTTDGSFKVIKFTSTGTYTA